MTSNISDLNSLRSNTRVSNNSTYGNVSLPQVQGNTEDSAQYRLSQMKNKIAYGSDTGGLQNKGKNKIARW